MPSKKSTKKQVTGRAFGQKTPINSNSIRTLTITILTAASIALIFYCKSFDFIQDDSFITYRYVKNFTESNGLVFNIGERVEGYTCFLWVILLSLVKITGANFISASQTFGIIFSLFTIYFTYRISTDIFPKNKGVVYDSVFGLISVVLLISNGAFAYWAVSGMETAMFTFLITLAIYLYLKELGKSRNTFPYSALIFLAASLTRPEGNLIFAITVLHKILTVIKNPSVKDTEMNKKGIKDLFAKQNLVWIGLYLIPALSFMIWRYSYYGFLFPNTFYAKTGSSLEYIKTGLDYFTEFGKTYGLYGILIAIIFVNLRRSERFYDYLYLIMLFSIYSIYVVYIGGDVLRPARFFVPMLPIFYILVQESVCTLISINTKKIPSHSTTYLAGIVLLIIAYLSYKQPFDEIKRYSELENGLVEKMKLTAQWLKNKSVTSNRHFTVAATTIGAISYYSDVTLIDMLGLTDKEIAHNPKPIPEISSNTETGWKERHYNVEYVLSRKPDYIYFSTGIKPSAYAERGLFTSDEFLRYYYPSYFTNKEQQFTDCIYKRKTEEEVKETKVLPPNPNFQKTFVNLFNQAMNTYRDKNKTQEAINLYKQTTEIAPSNFGIPYQMLGDLYMRTKNIENAIENYQKAVEVDDFSVMAHYSLYQMYLQKRDTANAQIHIDKVLKYSPDFLK